MVKIYFLLFQYISLILIKSNIDSHIYIYIYIYIYVYIHIYVYIYIYHLEHVLFK